MAAGDAAGTPRGPEVGRTFGRYLVLSELGAGGMGRVLAAYDAELDRRVALKLLHAGTVADGSKVEEYTVRLDGDGQERNLDRERILAEARAMARLSHPNLISVFEVGEVDDQVFLAMEHVSGVTLTDWLAERPRSLGEVLRVFFEIGRGLAAAHAAGLVHGDVKPSNVLVEPSGRARVIDFGLARAAYPEGLDAAGNRPPVMGTPRYIAPERLARAAVDARADQFAFGVMLSDAIGALGRRRGPRWLEPLVTRAQATDPADRYPSMEVLLRELRRRRRARGRALLALGAVALVVIALLVGRRAAEPVDHCDGGAARLVGVWDPAVEAEVHTVMRGTGRAYAEAVYQRTSHRLASYRGDWIAMHRQACQATAAGEQSSELLDRRMACLDRRLASLRQVAIVLRRAEDFGRAVEIVDRLPLVAACADAEALLAVVPLPDDPGKRAAAAAFERTIAAAEVDQAAGHIDVALRTGRAALVQAEAVGHAPLLARAGALIGRSLFDSGHPVEAEAALLAALDAAIRGRDDALTATIEVELVGVLGLGQRRVAEARLLGRVSDAMLSRAGPATEHLQRSRLLARLGAIALEQAELGEGEKLLTEARRYMEAHLPPDDRLIANAEDLLGTDLSRAGKYQEALGHYLKSLELTERAVGPDHPQVADVLNNLGACYAALHREEERRAMYLRALAIVDKLPDYHSTTTILNNLASVELTAGHFELAIGYHERALAVLRARKPPPSSEVGTTLSKLGLVYAETGALERALALQREALPLLEAALGADHPRLVATVGALGEALRRLGRAREALPQGARAVAIAEAKLGVDHPETRRARAFAALTLVDLGRGREGLKAIEQELTDLPANDPDRVQLLFGLARTLPADPARALAAVREARALAVTLRPHALPALDRWLAARAN